MSRAITKTQKTTIAGVGNSNKRNKILKASHRIDLLRERLSQKIKDSDSVSIIRGMRERIIL